MAPPRRSVEIRRLLAVRSYLTDPPEIPGRANTGGKHWWQTLVRQSVRFHSHQSRFKRRSELTSKPNRCTTILGTMVQSVIGMCLPRMERGWFGHYKFPLHSLLCSPFHFPIVCLSNTYCHTQCVTTVWIDSGLRPSQSVCCPSLCTICLWPPNGRSKFH